MALDDDTLQRYYDGSLSPDEQRGVARAVAENPGARRRLSELSRLSELMRQPGTRATAELDSDALFAAIETGIQREQQLGVGARLRVVASEWYEHKKAVVVPALASMAVAAAALLTFLVPHGLDDPGTLQEPSSPMAALIHGSSIENVDFGASTGTVFEVESEGVRAAVVWIADEDEEAP